MDYGLKLARLRFASTNKILGLGHVRLWRVRKLGYWNKKL